MSRLPRRRRLSSAVYIYTAFCVASAVAIFMLVAEIHQAIRGRPPLREMPVPVATATDAQHPPSLHSSEPHHWRVAPPPPQLPSDLLIAAGIVLLALVAVTSFLFARRLLRPLRKLEDAALAFANGDMTARADLDMDDEIGAVGGAFNKMAVQTVKLLRAQEELLANVSHELKTPLARMQVALDMATEDDVLGNHALLHELTLDASELQSIVSDVLASLRMAMLDQLEAQECIDMGQLLERAIQRFASLYPMRTLCVHKPATPVRMMGDRKLLRRVIDNLLDNARKYSDGDIVVRLHEAGDEVVVEVEDGGIGISTADLESIFAPFFRADRSRTRDTGGVGLGLNLVRRIVIAHGGTIDVRSVEGQGATFRLKFPFVA